MKAADARDTMSEVKITMAEYEELIRANRKLNALESAGVDNWEWYYDYGTLRRVKEELEKQGYRVAYSDGEIRSTKIFSISWG